MLLKLGRIAFLISLFVGLVGCGGQTTSTPAPTIATTPTSPAAGKAIVLAASSSDPGKTIQRFQPLADYLAAQLKELGITTGEVKVAPDQQTLNDWIKAGQVDLFFDSPYPAMIEIDKAGAEPLLRRWKGGVADYTTVIVVKADSSISSLADLKGHMIGFEDPFSTSGYFLPAVALHKAGLKLGQKSSEQASVAADEIGYLFSQDSENTVQWVLSGKVTAGAVDSPLFQSLPDESRKGLKVLAETERVPRHFALVRPGMDPALKNALKKLLLGLDQTAEGKELLKTFEKTSKFDEIPPEIGFEHIRELYLQMPAQ